MKKYPELEHPLVGRVLIKQADKFWHLISVDSSGKYHWLEVEEKTEQGRKYYVGRAPHNSMISSGIIDGERLYYPKNTRSY
ncbi:MAG TPA: hypothetical protein V6C76_12725 [Drouetiella sp.]